MAKATGSMEKAFPATPSVYLETTIPSYLASRPSRDLVTAAHQQITQEWWDQSRSAFRLFISEAVLEEIRAGDPVVAARRAEFVRELPVLALRDDVLQLTRVYGARLGLPPLARTDLVHIAFAVAYDLEYILTWNCKHLANGQIIRRLMKINQELQRPTPIILTPEELQESGLTSRAGEDDDL